MILSRSPECMPAKLLTGMAYSLIARPCAPFRSHDLDGPCGGLACRWSTSILHLHHMNFDIGIPCLQGLEQKNYLKTHEYYIAV